MKIFKAVKTYRTKIDLWLLAVLIIVPALPPIIHLLLDADKAPIKIFIFATLAIYLLFLILFPFYYTFREDGLEIRIGLFIRGKIPYKNMTGFRETRMSFWDKAPAMSADCVRIELNTRNINPICLTTDSMMSPRKYALVSPKYKKEFMRELAQRFGKTEE